MHILSSRHILTSLLIVSCAALTTGCATRAGAGDAPPTNTSDVTISFSTKGSVIVDFTFKHAADTQHYCATSAQPWAHADVNGQSVEVPPGPPSYELRYDAGSRRAAEHFRLSAFNYHSGMTTHSDPANDWIDFWADGDEWLGHGGSADPDFKMDIAFAADGRSGTFTAHHLRAARDGKVSQGNEAVDVKGEWQCPFAATVPTSP